MVEERDHGGNDDDKRGETIDIQTITFETQ